MVRRIVISALMMCIVAAFVSAEVPQLLNYQGKLTDNLGKPVDGTRAMTFEFYDAGEAGNLLGGFTETQQVTVTKGVFSVLIGSATTGGVPAAVFDGASVYLSGEGAGRGVDAAPAGRLGRVCDPGRRCG